MFIATFIFLLSVVLTGCHNSLEPTVKEGRFDFSVTYEVDGEIKNISGVFVCEFVGAGSRIDGYYVEWNSYFLDDFEELFPVDHYNCIVVKEHEYGTIYLNLDLQAKYLMSEPGYLDSNRCVPYLVIEYYEDKVDEIGSYSTDDAKIIESYGVKIISYDYDAPIENTYK